MTDSIRRLTSADWPAVESVMDSRKTFQGLPVSDDWHSMVKLEYVLARIDHPNVYFYGYFQESSLVAIYSFWRFQDCDYMAGISWSKKGTDLPKAGGTPWPRAIVDLVDYAVAQFESAGSETIWWVSPATPSWVPVTSLSALANSQNYDRVEIGTVEAGCFSGNTFVDQLVLSGKTLPLPQVVYKFVCLHPVPVHTPLPDGAPPPGMKEYDPTKHVAPPRKTANTVDPAEMPPTK